MKYTKKEYYEHTFSIQDNKFELTIVLTDNKLCGCYMYSKICRTAELQRVFVFSGKKTLQAMKNLIDELGKIINYVQEKV